MQEDGGAGAEAAYVALALPGGPADGLAQPGGAQRLLVLRVRAGKAGGLQAHPRVLHPARWDDAGTLWVWAVVQAHQDSAKRCLSMGVLDWGRVMLIPYS